MKSMLTNIFACLDILTFLITLPRIRIIRFLSYLYAERTFNPIIVSQIILGTLSILLCISYLFTAYGFLREKKWALILYYCQFPLRIGFCTGSLIFFSLINKILGYPFPYYVIGITILLGELVRLILTIILHIRLNRTRQTITDFLALFKVCFGVCEKVE